MREIDKELDEFVIQYCENKELIEKALLRRRKGIRKESAQLILQMIEDENSKNNNSYFYE